MSKVAAIVADPGASIDWLALPSELGPSFAARAARINLATRVSREMRGVIQPKLGHIKPQNRRQ